jgi:hypothetical protein
VAEELYDVQTDPFQLDNLMEVGEPPLGLRDDLLQRMQALCVPVPPSFDYDI